MTEKKKVALLSARSGFVNRGVEKWSFELRKRLPYNVRVFSLFKSDWTYEVKGLKRNEPAYRYYFLLHSLTKKMRSLHPKINLVFVRLLGLNACNTVFLGPDDGEVISYSLSIKRELDLFKPDIILNHMGGTLGNVLKRYRTQKRIPFISVGGAGIGDIEYRNALSMPNAYIAQTPCNQMFISQKVPGLRVELIPNGFDVKEFVNSTKIFSEDELNRRNLHDEVKWERPYILSTSHFDPHKGLDRLIDAVSVLSKGTLIFTGDGLAKDALLQKAREKLPGRFAYFGVLPWDDLPILYRTVDVFSLPSVAEPFGGVFVEALGANTPVVAHRDLDREWIIGNEGGVLTNVLNIEQYANALKVASEQEWGDGPRKQALNLFNWDSVCNKYTGVIESVMELYNRPFEELP